MPRKPLFSPQALLMALCAMLLVPLLPAHARPVIVFDMDHTLVDTNVRLIAILRDVGIELNLPQLLALEYRQIEPLRSGDFSLLGIDDPEVIGKIFGDRAQGTLKESLFGRKFYFDASYLKYDAVMPGGPEFVERLALALDAHVLYLTGRTKELFGAATIRQLEAFDFPGFGARSEFRDRVSVILKPQSYAGDTDDFKAEELERFSQTGPVVAVFDDSKRNANKFRQRLHPQAVIVRLNRNVLNAMGLEAGVDQITNYVYNIAVDASGSRVVSLNREQIEAMVQRAQRCAQLLR